MTVLCQGSPRRHVARGLGARGGVQGDGAGPLVHAGVQLQHGPPGERAAAHTARGPGRPARAARPPPS